MKKRLEGVNVLLVEDDEEYARIMSERLRRQGCIVTICYNGDMVFDFLKGIIADIIIMDVNLPGKDGYTLCKELKGDDRYSKIPLVLLSADNDSTTSTRYSDRINDQSPADAHLVKTYGATKNLVDAIIYLLKL